MSENITEVIVGGVVLVVAAGFLAYAGKLTGVSGAGQSTYEMTASFRSANGIDIGTDVRLAGVKVGRVTQFELDKASFRATTHFTVLDGIELPEDSAVAISSEGLLGGNYVELLPGGSPIMLSAGDEIEFTQGSVSLVSLLMKFAAGSGSGTEGSGDTTQ